VGDSTAEVRINHGLNSIEPVLTAARQKLVDGFLRRNRKTPHSKDQCFVGNVGNRFTEILSGLGGDYRALEREGKFQQFVIDKNRDGRMSCSSSWGIKNHCAAIFLRAGGVSAHFLPLSIQSDFLNVLSASIDERRSFKDGGDVDICGESKNSASKNRTPSLLCF
jgi:hypothetical protein